jgi:nicotinamide riboside kinase
MKIAVIGTHGVGKTTLCNKLAIDFVACGQEAFVITETVRDTPFPINADFTPECAIWIYGTQIKRELEACLNHDTVICDRSVIDSLIYARALNIRTKLLDKCFRMAEEWMKTYDVVIYVSMDGTEIHSDGFRSTDLEFQKNVQREFTSWVYSKELYFPLTIMTTKEIFGG